MRDLPDRVALAVTYVLSPPVLPPLLVWLLLAWTRAPDSEIAVLTTATVVLLSAVPVAFLVWMVRSGRSATVNLEDRKHRAAALGLGGAGAVVLALLTYYVATGARVLLLASLLGFLLTAVLLVVINRAWRISLHAASAAGFSSVVLFVLASGAVVFAAPSPSAVAILCVVAILLVGWSRIHLRAHSVGQVVAGTLLGLAVPYATLSAIDAIRPVLH